MHAICHIELPYECFYFFRQAPKQQLYNARLSDRRFARNRDWSGVDKGPSPHFRRGPLRRTSCHIRTAHLSAYGDWFNQHDRIEFPAEVRNAAPSSSQAEKRQERVIDARLLPSRNGVVRIITPSWLKLYEMKFLIY